MTESTKRILIAAAVAVVLIAGSVTAIALTDDDDDDERRGPLVAIAEEFDDEMTSGQFLEDLLERFANDDAASALPERLLDLLDGLFDDLRPFDDEFEDAPFDPEDRPRRFRGDPDDRRPFDGFGFFFGPEGPRFFGDRGFDPFFGGREFSPEDLERLFRNRFGHGGFGFQFGQPREPFAIPEFPFAVPDGPDILPPLEGLLDDFLQDGFISPEEARELERLLRESTPGGMFRFEFVPPVTDRIPSLPEAFADGLGMIPFREFFADGELDTEEQDALRLALNEWLNHLFEEFGSQ